MRMYLQVWEAVSGKCVATLVGHKEEVLDVCFDLSGQLIATASADGENKSFTKNVLITLLVMLNTFLSVLIAYLRFILFYFFNFIRSPDHNILVPCKKINILTSKKV